MLKREPFYKLSFEILSLAKKDDVEEYVSASAITDIYYRNPNDYKEAKMKVWKPEELLL